MFKYSSVCYRWYGRSARYVASGQSSCYKCRWFDAPRPRARVGHRVGTAQRRRAWLAQLVQRLATAWTVQGWNGGKKFVSSPESTNQFWGLAILPWNGYRGSFPGRNFDHSPPSSAEVKNKWSYTSLPLYAFKAWIGTSLPLPQTEVFQKNCSLVVWSNWASGVYVASNRSASTSRLDTHWALVCGAYPQFVLATLSVLRTLNHLMIRWLEGM